LDSRGERTESILSLVVYVVTVARALLFVYLAVEERSVMLSAVSLAREINVGRYVVSCCVCGFVYVSQLALLFTL
jgi:hypothetical protein